MLKRSGDHIQGAGCTATIKDEMMQWSSGELWYRKQNYAPMINVAMPVGGLPVPAPAPYVAPKPKKPKKPKKPQKPEKEVKLGKSGFPVGSRRVKSTKPVAPAKKEIRTTLHPAKKVILRTPSGVPLSITQIAELQEVQEQERLRDLRLSALRPPPEEVPSGPPLEGRPGMEDDPDNPRDSWARATKLFVWSDSCQRWFPGVLARVDEEGSAAEKLVVHYRADNGLKSQKMITRDSELIRLRISLGKPNRAGITPAKEEPDTFQSPGWSEHKDKRSGRYYYNNKSTGETLWDTQAVKRGVIPRVRPA